MLAVGGADRIVADGAVNDTEWAARIGSLAKSYVTFAAKLAG